MSISSSSSREKALEKTKQYLGSLTKREFPGHKKFVHAVAWNSDGRKLASGSIDHTAKVRNIDSTGLHGSVTELKGHTDSVHALTWHPNNPDILATSSVDRTVRIWDVRNGKTVSPPINTTKENINITWSSNGDYIAVGSKQDTISLIDGKNYSLLSTHKFQFAVNEMTFNKNCQYFLLTTQNGTIEIREFPTFKSYIMINPHVGSVYCIQFDPTYRYLATGGADSLISLWDVNELICLKMLFVHESPIRSLSFSHNGQLIASASEDTHIDISDIESGQTLHTISVNAEMNSLSWNPKELLLAYCGDDRDHYSGKDSGTCYVWGYHSSSRHNT